MPKGIRPFLGVSLLIHLGTLSVLAAEVPGIAPSREFKVESPAQVEADFVEYREKERLILARGNVSVRFEGRALLADEAEVNLEAEEVKARGNVILMEGPNRLEGERLEYNYRSGLGVLYRGMGFAAPSTGFAGVEIHKEGEGVFRLVKGSFTGCKACQEAPYDWEVRAREATIYQGEYVFAKGASLWLRGFPALYSPFFSVPLGPRRTGFLVPRPGYGSRSGFFLKQPFFWAISESQDATFTLTYRSKKGFEEGLEYRYILSEVAGGEFSALHLRERDTNRDRSSIKFHHDQLIAPNLSFRADLNYLSDKSLEREYVENTLIERTRRTLDSKVYLVQSWPRHSLVALVEVDRDLAEVQDDRLQRVPELRFNAMYQPLGESPFFYELGSSAAYLERRWVEAGRVDLRPQFSLPLRLAPWARFTPAVALRETAYTRKSPQGGATSREVFEFQGRLETRLFRNFEVGRESLTGIRHVVEPRVLYQLLPSVNQRELPQFDAVDFVSPQNRITYSLGNRFLARLRGEGGETRSLEFLSLTISQAYNLTPKERDFSDIYLGSLTPERIDQSVKDIRSIGDGFSRATERKFSNIVADLALTPSPLFTFKATAGYNAKENQADSINANLRLNYPGRGFVELGSSYVRGQQVQAYTGTLKADLGKGLSLDLLTRYDASRSVLLENNLTLKYATCCWEVSLRYIHRGAVDARPAEDHFGVVFELKTGR